VRTHQIVSSKSNKTAIRPKWGDKGPRIPFRFAKKHKGNNTTAERPSGQSLAARRGSGAPPTSRPSEWSTPRPRGPSTRPTVILVTPHLLDYKPLKGLPIPPRPQGLHPPGALARTHRIVLKTKTNQNVPTVSCSQTSGGVPHSSTGSGATIEYQNTQGTQQGLNYGTLHGC
jgi:hypothetical protein